MKCHLPSLPEGSACYPPVSDNSVVPLSTVLEREAVVCGLVISEIEIFYFYCGGKEGGGGNSGIFQVLLFPSFLLKSCHLLACCSNQSAKCHSRRASEWEAI